MWPTKWILHVSFIIHICRSHHNIRSLTLVRWNSSSHSLFCFLLPLHIYGLFIITASPISTLSSLIRRHNIHSSHTHLIWVTSTRQSRRQARNYTGALSWHMSRDGFFMFSHRNTVIWGISKCYRTLRDEPHLPCQLDVLIVRIDWDTAGFFVITLIFTVFL
jgi:hypothetical protein